MESTLREAILSIYAILLSQQYKLYMKCRHPFYEHSINIISCLNCCFMPLYLFDGRFCATYSIDYLLLLPNTATNSPFLTKLLSDAPPKRPLKNTFPIIIHLSYPYNCESRAGPC